MSQLDLSYYLRNVLEMTGCFSKFPILGYPLLDGRQQAPV